MSAHARTPRAEACTGVLAGSAYSQSCPCSSCVPLRHAHCALARSGRQSRPDDVAVLRVLTGDRPGRLLAPDKREVVRQATLRGETAQMVADRLRCSRRQVYRYRASLRPKETL